MHKQLDAIAIDRMQALVPAHIHDAIVRYIEQGINPGGFLSAVIDNDLTLAVGQADDENLKHLGDIVRWFYNYAPSMCWGRADAARVWSEWVQKEAKEEAQAV